MNQMKSLRIVVLFLLLLLPVRALAANHTVTGGVFDLSSTAAGDTVTVNAGATATLTGTAPGNVSVTCASGVALTLDNAIINNAVNFGTGALRFTGSGNSLNCLGTSTLISGGYRAGIHVDASTTLSISGSGTLYVYGGESSAGIGGGDNESAGTIKIYSGTIVPTGGFFGAGIGGGDAGAGGTIELYGGTITATGGYAGAGIGGGLQGAGGTITITGGTVEATGGIAATGIGGGGAGTGGTVVISGGTVTATGVGDYAAGIGSCNAAAGSVTISGGTVTAVSGSYAAGIGGGGNNASGGSITISGGIVSATGGRSGAGIGGGPLGSGGVISILDGTITANGGSSGAGIGGGGGGTGGTIAISGGTITATGGSEGAGIGGGISGAGGNITISGGTLIANGGLHGAGIGGGGGTSGHGGTITITDGTVTAEGGALAAGIGGGYIGIGGTTAISGGLVYAARGSNASAALDIGPGEYSSGGGSLEISDTAAIFLRYDTYTAPTLPDGHEHKTPGDLTDPMIFSGDQVYGLTVPAGPAPAPDWTGSLGGFFRLLTITYHPNEGIGTTPSSPPAQHIGTVIPAADGSNLTKSGYTYIGWSTLDDGTGLRYATGDAVELVPNLALYARWYQRPDAAYPQTGDPSHPVLMAVIWILSSAGITLLSRRKRQGSP